MRKTLKNNRKQNSTGQINSNSRCQKRDCQKWQSIRSQNPIFFFFYFVDKNGKNKSELNLCKII